MVLSQIVTVSVVTDSDIWSAAAVKSDIMKWHTFALLNSLRRSAKAPMGL